MDCGECQHVLSAFIDGDLDDGLLVAVTEHLAVCAECTVLRDDLAEILMHCRGGDVAPPNSDALWRRINNLIEAEMPAEADAPPEKLSWLERGWNLTFSQAGAAVAGVALISSLLTIVAIRSYFAPPADPLTADERPSMIERVLSRVGLAESPEQRRERRNREQQAAIDYWNQRVQARRAMWDERIRLAFDRNLSEIDKAVSEYTMILEKDPEDKLSEEMLDSALTEKMNLLRQFSEL